jgi:hypothetical protein
VARLRDYESALLQSYQAYLKALLAAADAAGGGAGTQKRKQPGEGV